MRRILLSGGTTSVDHCVQSIALGHCLPLPDIDDLGIAPVNRSHPFLYKTASILIQCGTFLW